MMMKIIDVAMAKLEPEVPSYRGFDQDVNDNVLRLARTISRAHSVGSIDSVPGTIPVLQTEDPRLDPNSDSFDLKLWVRNARKLIDGDPKYKMPSLGVTYKNLRVTGQSGGEVDYQLNMMNSVVKVVSQTLLSLGWVKAQHFDILKALDGICKPGELTVVLGRPGAGCLTLLKTLTGHTYGFKIDKESDISFDGLSIDEINSTYRGEVAYCAETETHFPHLTVGQTLEFALKMKVPETRPEGVTREMYANHIALVYMATYGLTHTKNTKVGDDYVRGVSGGERKRVSITEVAISQSPFQCWDNSTRGLDSATALEFISALKTTADVFLFTPVVAIYQCLQDAYDYFDRTIVLYEGYQIYNGPAGTAKSYFENMGFFCPDRQTVADFLTSITSPSERIPKEGWEKKVPKTAEEFYTYWQSLPERQALLNEIDERRADVNSKEYLHESHVTRQAKHTNPKNAYLVSYPMQIRYCVERGFNRMKGAPSISIFQVVGNLFISLVISSIFYNLPITTSYIYNRATALFFAILFNSFFSLLELFPMYEARPIVEKHKLYALYRPSAEALSSIITEFPVKLLTSFCFNIVWYFMIHFKYNAGNFFFYMLINFFSTLAMSHMFRSIGSATRTLSEAMSPAALLLLALTIFTGFIIPTPKMLGWCRWINYINPIAYSFEALLSNEFTGRKFSCDQFVPAGKGYPTTDEGFHRICYSVGAEPMQNYVDGDVYLQTAYNYHFSHRWRNFGILLGYVVFFLFVHLLIAERQRGIRLKGEVLLFQQRSNLIKKKKIDDIESGSSNMTAKQEIEDDLSNSSQKLGDNIKKEISMRPIFHFRNITYDVQIKTETRTILNNVDGWVKPGQVTALMGASGAGKTTLLNALSERLESGTITRGTRMINGRHLDASFQRSIGYVQQQDLHLNTSTVREALKFAADLRQPSSTPEQEKKDYVNYIIELLEMEKYADAVVGVPGEGLNVEQRKRLTIGVELVAKPKLLLFLDEPTSGLDSQTAWSICKLIRKLADSGQAILCTIHQPSAILLQYFDRLLFLQRGGQTVYFGDLGENFKTLIDYFEANSSLKCPPEANPAEWMLKVIGAAPGSHAEKDFFETWRNSPQFAEVQTELDNMEIELAKREKVTTAEDMKTYATPIIYQYFKVTKRVLEQYWRTPFYLYSKILLTIISCLFNGFSFFHADKLIQGLQDQMFSIFMFLVLFAPLCFQYLPHYVLQRSLYEVRERPLKTFSWFAFITAQISAEIPWQLVTGTLAFLCWYYPVGFYNNATETDSVHERGGLMWFIIVLFFIYISTFSQLCVSFLDLPDNAANLALLGFSMCLGFCGVLITKDKLPGFWIFMYRVSPLTYLVSAVALTALANSSVTCASNEILLFYPEQGLNCSQYLAPYMLVAGGTLLRSLFANGTEVCRFCPIATTNVFLDSVNAKYSDRGRNIGIFIAFIVINGLATVVFYYSARVPKGDRQEQSHGPFRKLKAYAIQSFHSFHERLFKKTTEKQ